MEPISLSVGMLGSLNLPDFCPGCFWIRLHCQDKFPFQIPLPGIFIAIDSYGKKLIHSHFDQHRALPAWLPRLGAITGYVPKLDWRWFQCEHADSRITLRGTPDDIFALADGSYHIVDYKTAKLTRARDALFPQYEVQLNAYAYLAQRLTKRPALSPVSALSLVYMEPKTDVATGPGSQPPPGETFSLPFKATLVPVQLRPEELIDELLLRARETFEMPRPPDHLDDCKDYALLQRVVATVLGG